MASSEFTQVEVHQLAERLREEVLTIDRLSMFAQQVRDGQLSDLLQQHRDQHVQQYQQLLSVLEQGQAAQGMQPASPPYAGHEPAGYGTYRAYQGNHGDENR